MKVCSLWDPEALTQQPCTNCRKGKQTFLQWSLGGMVSEPRLASITWFLNTGIFPIENTVPVEVSEAEHVLHFGEGHPVPAEYYFWADALAVPSVSCVRVLSGQQLLCNAACTITLGPVINGSFSYFFYQNVSLLFEFMQVLVLVDSALKNMNSGSGWSPLHRKDKFICRTHVCSFGDEPLALSGLSIGWTWHEEII